MGASRFAAALRSCRQVVVDTQALSYYLLGHPRYARLTGMLFTSIEHGQVRAVISAMSFAELMALPFERGDRGMVARFEEFFATYPNLTVASLDVRTARTAAEIRATTRLSLPDAAIIATAQQTGADAIVSNDQAWRNRFAKPRLILLNDYAQK